MTAPAIIEGDDHKDQPKLLAEAEGEPRSVIARKAAVEELSEAKDTQESKDAEYPQGSKVGCDHSDDIGSIASKEYGGFAFGEKAQEEFDGEEEGDSDVKDFKDIGAVGEEDLGKKQRDGDQDQDDDDPVGDSVVHQAA